MRVVTRGRQMLSTHLETERRFNKMSMNKTKGKLPRLCQSWGWARWAETLDKILRTYLETTWVAAQTWLLKQMKAKKRRIFIHRGHICMKCWTKANGSWCAHSSWAVSSLSLSNPENWNAWSSENKIKPTLASRSRRSSMSAPSTKNSRILTGRWKKLCRSKRSDSIITNGSCSNENIRSESWESSISKERKLWYKLKNESKNDDQMITNYIW